MTKSHKTRKPQNEWSIEDSREWMLRQSGVEVHEAAPRHGSQPLWASYRAERKSKTTFGYCCGTVIAKEQWHGLVTWLAKEVGIPAPWIIEEKWSGRVGAMSEEQCQDVAERIGGRVSFHLCHEPNRARYFGFWTDPDGKNTMIDTEGSTYGGRGVMRIALMRLAVSLNRYTAVTDCIRLDDAS